MSNDSSTGGFLNSPQNAGNPTSLTLIQFIQTVLTGMSGLPGNMVRPMWQENPPKAPDVGVNWIAFGISMSTPDANSWLGSSSNGVTTMQRHEEIIVRCSFLGVLAFDYTGLVRDGFSIPQNFESLRSVNMGFVDTSPVMHVPDLLHERWVERYTMDIKLRRIVQRTYPILTFASANGTIHAASASHSYLIDWKTKQGDT